MRVKIKGEITVERLAEALEAAAKAYESVRPGHKIYGANLYLTAYDADGHPYDLIDHNGEPLMLVMEPKSGELVRPALSDEGVLRKKNKKNEKNRIEKEIQKIDKEVEQQRREREIRNQKFRESLELANKAIKNINELTAALLKTMPERFVGDINEIVQSVWIDFKPVEPHGKNKGLLKPVPVFSVGQEALQIFVETWKAPRRLANPIFTLSNDEFVTLWNNEAWDEAVVRIKKYMDRASALVVNT